MGDLQLLPGEIRNIVYDLATRPEPEPIALLSANPKSLYKPLLLVSRQFNQEVRQFYREACLRFWTHHDFEVILPSYVPGAKGKAIKDTRDIIRTVDKMRDIELQQICMLKVRTLERVFTLDDAAGLWPTPSWQPGHDGDQWYVLRHGCKHPRFYDNLELAQTYFHFWAFHPQIHGTIKEQIVCFAHRHWRDLDRLRHSTQ